MRSATAEELAEIDGVGPIMAAACAEWFADPKNAAILDDLLGEVAIEQPRRQSAPQSAAGEGTEEAETGADASGDGREGANPISGKTFVVTGSVYHFKNRRELQNRIEDEGGKVTGSVSKKTDYLINNDVSSGSNKNVTAKKLGVPIITEEDFLSMLGEKA